MATAPGTTPVAQDEEELPRATRATHRTLREKQLEDDLQVLKVGHQEKRQARSQELRELAVSRKAIQDQLWADWISSAFPDLGPGRHDLTPEQQLQLPAELPRADRCVNVVKHHLDAGKEREVDARLATVLELGEEEAASKVKYLEKLAGREENRRSSQQVDGASCSSPALNGKLKEGPGEKDEENPYWVQSVLEASQQRDKEKQALLKELLPAKGEVHVEVERLLEVLDEEALRKAYDRRIKVEDPHEIKARQRTVPAERAGLWPFVSKKKVEATRKDVEVEGSAEADIDYVDNEKLGRPKLPECYAEIKNLLNIEKNPIFSATLKEWTRKEELYHRRVESNKSLVASLTNEVYQLIGFFSVFQGVVLTAVSQSTFLYCHNKWSPITLSVLASVISTLAVIQKLIQIHELQTKIVFDDRDYRTAVQVGNRLREVQVGERFREPPHKGLDFVQLNLEIERNANRKSKWWKKRHPWIYFVLVILALVAFGVLFPISFWRILCEQGSSPAVRSPPAP